MENWWIKKRLADLGKNGVGLASALGIASARTTEIYKGIRKVQAHEIEPLAKYLELPVADVMAKLGVSNRPPSGTAINADLLAQIAQIVDSTLSEQGITLDQRAKFLIITRTYEALAGTAPDELPPAPPVPATPKNKLPPRR